MLEALLSVLLARIIAGIVKMFTDKRPLAGFSLGGMPSMHAAVVAALFLAVYFEQGWSLLVLVVGVFAAIVLTDAVGVRQEVSRHSLILNKKFKRKDFNNTGHTYLEIIIGALIGFVVTFVVYNAF